MPHPPDIAILLAPAAAGKTEAALGWMAQPRRGRAILLVPSGLHRDRLAPRVRGVMRRASVGQPSRIVSLILRTAGLELPPASPTLRARLLRAELRRLAAAGDIPRLAPAAHKPGLAAELLALIDELQAARVTPAALAAADVGPYDGELAAIYAAYRSRLAQIGHADEAGRTERAIAALRADGRLLAGLELLVVDGFDQLTPLQIALLRALAGRAARTRITLTGGPAERPAQIRFARTLRALTAALPAARVEQLAPAGAPAGALAHAAASLFELDATPAAGAGGAITLTRAPDREREVRAALRHIRRLLDAGAARERVAVIFRSAAPYAPLLREVAAEYGLPLAIAAGRPLIEAPAIAALLARLERWPDPPARATPADYVALVESTALPAADARAESAHQRPEEQRLRRLLAELAAAARLLDEPAQPFGAFLAELRAAIAAASYDQQPPAPGQVAALDALSARGASFEHVALLGLAEGEFPARLAPPPFYTRRERRALAARGVDLAAADPADERSLFYEAVARARRSLALSYTGLDERGNPLGPSPYLRDLLGRFAPASIPERHIRAGSPPAIAEAASTTERLIALMAAGQPLDTSDPLQSHVARACAIERQREAAKGDYGPHEGVIGDATRIAALRERFGPQHRWSVTQINDYTTCPFRFAAAHILRIRPPEEPGEGIEQVGRGRLLHAILARAGQRWAARGLPADSAHEQAYQADLRAAADELLASAPQDYGFAPGPLWEWEQAELRATLARALRRSLHAGDGWAQYTPAHTEASFGMGPGRPPLPIDTPAGPAHIIGRIDRIDRAADGSLALTDYKSGSTPPSLRDTLRGRDVQLTVYSLAAEQLLGASVGRASYLALGSGRRSAPLTPAERDEAVSALRASLGAAIAGARAGAFPVRPSEGCPPGCAYAAICRVNHAR